MEKLFHLDQKMVARSATFMHHPHRARVTVILTFLALMLVASACSGNNSTSTTSPQPTSVTTPTIGGTTPSSGTSVTPQANIPPTSVGYPINVYFSKHPESDHNLDAVFPVTRNSPNLAVATFAITNLIQGPTQQEQSKGYYSSLHGALTGTSNCGGADFELSMNTKASTPQQGTATLKFCRVVSTAGIGTDAAIRSEITASLAQFSTIKKVIILTNGGSCFADESGMNLCLK